MNLLPVWIGAMILSAASGSLPIPHAHAGVLEQATQNSLALIEGLESTHRLACSSKPRRESEACEVLPSLSRARHQAGLKEDLPERNRLTGLYKTNLELCMDERFRRCYPDRRPSISQEELRSLFKTLKSDPRFRFPGGGGGMCHYRAHDLSIFLAERGLKTKTLRIEHSPTLIAMDRDREGRLNGNYDDYRGFHTVVQVEVRVGGRSLPYVLDPQYMEEALPRDEYFLKTTGQVCQRLRSKSDEADDLTQCYYRFQKENQPPDDPIALFETRHAERTPYLDCGWLRDLPGDRQHPSSTKKDKLIVCTNGTTPEKFLNQMVTPSTYKELIEEAYSSYEKKLLREREEAKSQLYSIEESLKRYQDKKNPFYLDTQRGRDSWKRRLEVIESSLSRIPEMRKRIRANLERLP